LVKLFDKVSAALKKDPHAPIQGV